MKDRSKKELYEGAAKIAVEKGQKNTWGLTREQIFERNLKLNKTIKKYLANNEEKVSNEALQQALSEFNINLPILQPNHSNKVIQSYLDQFPLGIPCRSYHLENNYKKLGDIVSRNSLIVYAPCEVIFNKDGIYLFFEREAHADGNLVALFTVQSIKGL